MTALVLAVAVALQLGGGFGEASAQVVESSDGEMIVEIQVEVGVRADAVVAHLAVDGEPDLTLPLLERGGGVFGARTELATRNYVVVFEAVGADGRLSSAVTLSELGADLGPGPGGATAGSGSPEGDGLSNRTRRLGWLALALGAASLSALAFWALGGDTPKTGPEDEGA